MSASPHLAHPATPHVPAEVETAVAAVTLAPGPRGHAPLRLITRLPGDGIVSGAKVG